jgi:cytochrome c oxidase assembly protein subunit 15
MPETLRQRPEPASKAVRRWLLIMIGLIAAMVLVGGATRLTGSGLSMVEWHPLMGAIPPLSEAAWLEVFGQYQRSPQFVQVNSWMQLGDFQRIFLWEYAHRLLGRLIGLAFIIPWVGFMAAGHLRGRRAVQAGIGLGLGALQGLLGWYMVQSGLVDRPEVSHLRLAAHLGLAFFTALYLLWLWLAWGPTAQRDGDPSMRRWLTALLGLIALQSIYGAFVAGLRAGLISNSFPLMFGSLIPVAQLGDGPLLETLIQHPIGVHFMHRSIAWLVVAASLICAWLGRRRAQNDAQRRCSVLLALIVVVQFTTGALTVLTSVALPLALIHQLGALALLGSALASLHSFTKR